MDLNEEIKHRIRNNIPLSVSKIGSERLEAINSYLSNNNSDVSSGLHINSGVFPTGSNPSFFTTFVNGMKQLDYINIPGGQLHTNIGTIKRMDNYKALFPCQFQNPWTEELRGKTVLAISPFTKSIGYQFNRRELVWGDKVKKIMPFNLVTLKAPLSYAICNEEERKIEFGDNKSWTDVYNDLTKQMNDIDFDLLMVGAGAYGIPLCSYAKSLGKIGIDTGGGTQLIFGIRGGRWRTNHSELFNEHWILPSKEETPSGVNKVEGGCYW